MKQIGLRLLSGGGLILVHVLLFIAGTTLFPVNTGKPPDPAQAGAALVGMLACAAIDTALLSVWASGTQLRGYRRWAALAVAFYGVKTFSSQLEALWFMPNVTGSMGPALFAMTLPLCLVLPALIGAAAGDKAGVDKPAWRAPRVGRGVAVGAWVALSIFVYPVLFWSAGYFIAYQSAALREFYGGLRGDGFLSHLLGVFGADPWVGPFEAFRGLLWILIMLPLLRTSRRSWLWDALTTGAFLALVQNDVLFLPNPLMSPEVRTYHFAETASSNFVWGFVMVAVLRGWFEQLERRGSEERARLRRAGDERQ